MTDADLVVVGAGIYGITAAVTYRRIHPEARILLLEASPGVGGPWASHRIFPGLKTNNLWGTYANPDFPMDEEKFGVKRGEFLPAECVNKYLRAMVEENDISECVRLNTRVDVVEQTEEGWKLHCTANNDQTESTLEIKTAKLIFAIGFVNRPSMPKIPTAQTFTPLVVHSKDFPQHFNDIVKPNSNTFIIGGGKSAWDIAYACATQPGSTATMLIRPSGDGPAWLSPSHVTPFGLWLEKLVFTRFLGYMSPCPWAEMSGFEGYMRRFLHGTWLGKKIVGTFWKIMSDDVVRQNKMNEHPEVNKLRPWRDAFEVGNALSILTYPIDFFDLVREGKVKVIIDEVARFDGSSNVVLKGGETYHADAVVCATGWEVGSPIKFIPEGLEKELGLPTTKPRDDDKELRQRVTDEIHSNYSFLKERNTGRIHHPDPALRSVPTANDKQMPYRLYRFAVPHSDLSRRSVGFAGAVMCLGNTFCAYLQSIWLTAYFDGLLDIPPSSDELLYETYRDTEYGRLRCAMGYGDKFPDLIFDSLPYLDQLMKDLGFQGKRKSSFLGMTNWAAESFQSYGPEDYKGVLDEWQKRVKDQEGETKKTV